MSFRIFRWVLIFALFAFFSLPRNVVAQNATPTIAILGAMPPLTDATDAENAAAVLKRDGLAVEIVTPEQVADPQYFTPARFAAFVAPHCRLFPAVAQENLLAYLHGQGRLLCIGGPAFEKYAYREGDEWKPRERLTQPLSDALAAVKAPDLPTVSPPNRVFHIGSEIAGYWLPVAMERGIGFAGSRPGRLLPADARGTETSYSPEVRARQWAYVCLRGPLRGAIWGQTPKATPPNEPTFTPISSILRRMLQSAYLAKAGAERPAYFTEDSVVIGAEFANFGAARNVSLEIEIHGDGEQEFQKVVARPKETLQDGQISGYSETFQNLPPGNYFVRATLFEENGASEDKRPVLDRLTAPFRVMETRAPIPTNGVTIRKDGFFAGGKPFAPKAARFAPAWTQAQDAAAQNRGWLSPEQYDPELIERDMTNAAKQGKNVLWISCSRPDEAAGLRDFLARCQAHHVYVVAQIRDLNPASLGSLLSAARLWQSRAVFGVELPTASPPDEVKNALTLLHKLHLKAGIARGQIPLDAASLRLLPGTAPFDFTITALPPAQPKPRKIPTK